MNASPHFSSGDQRLAARIKFPLGICILLSIFMLSGLSSLASAIGITVKNRQLMANGQIATGEIVSLDHRKLRKKADYYLPVVRFTATDGSDIIFTGKSGSTASSHAVGDKLEVLYDPEKPQEAVINIPSELWDGVLVTSIFGAGFTGLSGLFYYVFIGQYFMRRSLLKNGMRISTSVTGIEAYTRRRYSHSHASNGGTRTLTAIRLKHIIKSQWQSPESGLMYLFESDPLRFNPAQYVKEGDKIDVLIDPRNPKRYVMDTSRLPELA